MDPNANVEERIALLLELLEGEGLSADDVARLDELELAYEDWRADGGFAAPAPALKWLGELEGRRAGGRMVRR